MRGQQLSETQISALLDPPPDQRELVRHYTLFAADLAAIRRCRGDHNRLGHALMLCYLRHPGRPLRADERPPRSLLLFIAEQIDALPEAAAAGRRVSLGAWAQHSRSGRLFGHPHL
jgi:TnpA family transposase